jgi:ATP-dependent Clp protease ATP-binding subunit ClpC
MLAREHAAQLGHEYVSPDHILLGILSEGHGVAATSIIGLGVELPALRTALEARMEPGAHLESGPDLPYTSRAKRVLELAMVEARDLRHAYVGSEHLLLGVLREAKSRAAAVLLEHGLPADRVRAEVLRLLVSDTRASLPEQASPGKIRSYEAPATRAGGRVALLVSVIALLVALTALVVALYDRR